MIKVDFGALSGINYLDKIYYMMDYYWNNFNGYSNTPLVAAPVLFGLGIMFGVLMVWSLVWKGMALWKSARLGHKWWFVILLVVNTLGILEILYIYVFAKKMGKKD